MAKLIWIVLGRFNDFFFLQLRSGSNYPEAEAQTTYRRYMGPHTLGYIPLEGGDYESQLRALAEAHNMEEDRDDKGCFNGGYREKEVRKILRHPDLVIFDETLIHRGRLHRRAHSS